MRLLLAMIALLSGGVVSGQLLTWTPPFPKEDDPSQTLLITVDANKGNKGLAGHAPNDVYVHIGVITNQSTGASNWKYVPFEWGTTPAAARAASAGSNQWSYTINGSLRSFFGITNASERIQKIAIIFRSGNGSKKQVNTDNSDMYLPVYGDTLAVRIQQPAREPKFVPTPEPQGWMVGSSITVQATANKASTLKLYHNGTLLHTLTNAQAIQAASTVAAEGNQQLVVEASDGTATKYDTVNIFVAPAASPTAALPAGVRDGINYEAGNSSVVLVLHAPEKTFATVIGDFNDWTQGNQYIMNRTPDGKKFWLRISGLTPGTEYGFQYLVDNAIRIADPYVQKVLDPWNDQWITDATYPNLKAYPTGKTTGVVGVLRTGGTAYNWAVPNFSRPDKRGLVIYELLVRDFVAAHDWKTLKDTLGYLKRLGVNAIELMPFNEFEGNESWGYNGDFFFAPDKYYGPASDLKAFIDHCHQNGIAVLMDLALNHHFGLSPMVQLYWDAANNRPAANSPWFNPVAKHPFNVGYDMNHESPDTRYYTSRVIEHWLQEYKIDGFRFDLSKGFTQKNSGDNVGTWGAFDQSRIDIWKRYYDTVQTKAAGAYVILEHFADNSEEKVLSDYGMLLWGNLNHNYNEATMGWLDNSNFSGVLHTSRNWSYPYLVGYMESHDEERLMHRNINHGNAAAGHNTKDTTTALKRMEQAAAFFFTVPGPKMIWQFGELGYDFPINYCPDGTVNNDCRTANKPIRWDYRQQARRQRLYEVYRTLIRLRFHPLYKDVFLSGAATQSLGGGLKWLSVNSGDTSRVFVVGNFGVSATSGTVTFPSSGTWYDYLDSTKTITATGNAQAISLPAGEYRVYLNRNVNNTTTTPVPNIPVPGTTNTLEAAVYPNPVTSGFSVEVHLPQSGATRLELVNAAGQPVATLYEGFKPKGKQLLTFDAPKGLAGGAYYLKITTRNSNKVLQVIIQ